MMKARFSKLALTAALAISVILPMTLPDVSYAADCNGTTTTFEWGCGSDGKSAITGVFITVFNWLAVGVTAAVIGGIVYGGILYSASAGDRSRAEKGMATIRMAVIALILYVAMFAIFNFLIPGGLFRSSTASDDTKQAFTTTGVGA